MGKKQKVNISDKEDEVNIDLFKDIMSEIFFVAD